MILLVALSLTGARRTLTVKAAWRGTGLKSQNVNSEPFSSRMIGFEAQVRLISQGVANQAFELTKQPIQMRSGATGVLAKNIHDEDAYELPKRGSSWQRGLQST